MTRVPFARTVVWRHPCDCPTASRPLEPSEEPEHRFDVDGAPFPWYITEAGATFRKAHGLYLVTVHIIPIRVTDSEPLHTTFEPHGLPCIGGKPFPWAIADDSITLTASRRDGPVLTLTFIAEHVDADVDIPEEETNENQP